MRRKILIPGSVVVASGAVIVAGAAVGIGLREVGPGYHLELAEDAGLLTLFTGLGIVGLELLGLLEPIAVVVSAPLRRWAGLPPLRDSQQAESPAAA